MAGPVEGELIGYYSRYRDKITSVLTGDVTESGRLDVQSQNAARLDLYGVEFGAACTASRTTSSGTRRLRGRAATRPLRATETPADRIPPIMAARA